jgi:hypothetical protein
MCAKNAFAYLGKEPVSSSCDFGASLTSKYLILSSDLDFPNDNNPVARIGMEVRIRDMLFLRAGLTTASEGGNSANLSCGVGLRAGDFRFDYAYAPVSDIGASHRCSVSFFFDRKIIAKKAKTDPVKTTNHGSRQPQNKRT